MDYVSSRGIQQVWRFKTFEICMKMFIYEVLDDHFFHAQVTVTNFEEAIRDTDVLYMTRIQRERFSSEEDYEKVRTCPFWALRIAELNEWQAAFVDSHNSNAN